MISQASSASGNILIVDDMFSNTQLLSFLLMEQGYQVREALDGEQALRLVDQDPPDLILLDIMMPGMDGYEVCTHLKANLHTRDIPVVFLSAASDTLGKVKAFNMGGADYITKPFQPEEVLVRVRNQLQIRQLQQQLQRNNQQLQQEVNDRILAQSALEQVNQQLESQVERRTAQLRNRNNQLLELQARLEEALAQEQLLNQLKSKLITTVSHEFNTPLSTIQLASELQKQLIPEQYCEESDRYHGMITESINRITQVIEDTKFLAQGESGQIQCSFTLLNLVDFCRAFVQTWTLPDSRWQLTFSHPSQVALQIAADPVLLSQILKNLTANAVRYSPRGGMIQIEVSPTFNFVSLHVRDQGIGIPAAEQDKIFDRFYRASNADSVPGTPGAGLGLAVVKHLVDLHQGSIKVDSVVGEGTTMTVQLPAADTSDSDLMEGFWHLDRQE